MINKEKKLNEELQKCRANIQRTRNLIAYHKEILRQQERKADDISAKLDAEKMKSLYTALNANGVDIDSLRQAVANGQITDKTTRPADAKPAETKKEDKDAETDSL